MRALPLQSVRDARAPARNRNPEADRAADPIPERHSVRPNTRWFCMAASRWRRPSTPAPAASAAASRGASPRRCRADGRSCGNRPPAAFGAMKSSDAPSSRIMCTRALDCAGASCARDRRARRRRGIARTAKIQRHGERRDEHEPEAPSRRSRGRGCSRACTSARAMQMAAHSDTTSAPSVMRAAASGRAPSETRRGSAR